MFCGIVPIDLNRFVESGVALVECPDCGRAWTLSPSGGVLRFKSHDKRKMNTPNTGRRWERRGGGTDWNVVGGEVVKFSPAFIFVEAFIFEERSRKGST